MANLQTRLEQGSDDSNSTRTKHIQPQDYLHLMGHKSEQHNQAETINNNFDFVKETRIQLGLKAEPGADAPDKSKSVDLLIKKMGISLEQKTDPEMLKDILRNDMKLDDCPTVTKLLGTILTEQQSMRPMLETIRTSIISKQPELQEFVSTAIKENLIDSPDQAAQALITRSLNYMVLLDAITKGMAEDPNTMEDVCKHIMSKRKEMGIREGFFRSAYDIYKAEDKGSGGMFLSLKTKSVDVAMDLFRKMRDKGNVGRINSMEARALVELNIAEAALADSHLGFKDNAKAGIYLDVNPASKVWISEGDKAIKYDYSQDWASLYESWNMAFVSHCSNPQLLFTKLLIPQVINSKPEDYILNRAISLWLTLNFDHFHAIEKKPRIAPMINEDASKRWGAINKAYGAKLGRD